MKNLKYLTTLLLFTASPTHQREKGIFWRCGLKLVSCESIDLRPNAPGFQESLQLHHMFPVATTWLHVHRAPNMTQSYIRGPCATSLLAAGDDEKQTPNLDTDL